MSWLKKSVRYFTAFAAAQLVFPAHCLFGAEKMEKYIPDAAVAESGMTLWQIIRSGGEVMVVLTLLSITAMALVIYYFITMKQDKLLPVKFLNEAVSLIEEQKDEDVKAFCGSTTPNLISDIVLAGVSRKGHEKVVIQEAMEDKAKRSITGLWQKLSYLADIAAIAPMLGLLGTVLGMIQAFNVIAFQTGAVKPVLLASGISKAMVTTAAGLIVAIPAMIFYSYFRGVMQSITTQFEHISSELIQLVTQGKKPNFGA
jgi:biopolymer transport protein ExbB